MAAPAPSIAPLADRRAALDRAYLGDIEGAIGTVCAFDTAPRRTLHRRLITLLAIAGPGLIVMAADNDAGTMTVAGRPRLRNPAVVGTDAARRPCSSCRRSPPGWGR